MLNIDGTGHPENGKQFNVWASMLPPQGFTSFTSILRKAPRFSNSSSAKRSREWWVATMPVSIALHHRDGCGAAILLAHLIRDVKYLTTLSDAVTCRFGEKLLERSSLVSCLACRETTPPERWQRKRRVPGKRSPDRTTGTAAEGSPKHCSAFSRPRRYYFTFLERRAWNRPTTAWSNSSAF